MLHSSAGLLLQESSLLSVERLVLIVNNFYDIIVDLFARPYMLLLHMRMEFPHLEPLMGHR